MNEPQYKPITGMIDVNDIQEIIDNNRYFQEEIERLNNDIKELLKENSNKEKVIKIQDNIINKANEYIEEWQKFPHTNGSTHKELRNLIQILKGSDKE